MIDENLPVFYFRKVKEKGVFDNPILHARAGQEAEPVYTLRRLDPNTPAAKNRYAIALFDAYIPDLLYGEVFLEPEWTLPSLSAETIRQNGGVAPPPQPILPNEFTVQLYNPDQQVKVRHIPPGWSSTATWEFAMPQETFKRPSASTIDRGESTPAALLSTPMINMRWKRTGKFSKDLMCYLTGKSQNPDGSKKKNKEPDIPLSFFHQFSELTVYEPNVMRLDMEDLKGFEVALILAATAIRDVYFNTLREVFHIYEIEQRAKASNPPGQPANVPLVNPNGVPLPVRPQIQIQAPGNYQPYAPNGNNVSTANDPKKQWEIDAETARLKYHVQEEQKMRERQEAQDRERARRLAKEEQNAEQRRRAEIEKETERLRKEWEAERLQIQKEGGNRPPLPPRGKDKHSSHHHHSRNNSQQPYLGTPTPDINTASGVFGPQVPRPQSSLGNSLGIFHRPSDEKETKKLVKKKKSSLW